ncbi:hypothetical protein BC567DRAFT_214239 [Phyllosticta citribraziliensis]
MPFDCDTGYLSVSYASSFYTSGNSTVSSTTSFTLVQQAKTCLKSGKGEAVSCWPFGTSALQADALSGGGYYSPGFFCPNGWTTACASVASGISYSTYSMFSFGFSVRPGDTVAGCCPFGFDCSTTSSLHEIQGCVRTEISIPATLLDCSVPSTPISRNPGDLTTSQAPMIQINWNSKDLESYSKSRNPAPVRISNSSQGLSSTTKIAISVIVPIVSLMLLIGSVLWFLRRRKARLLRARPQKQECSDLDKDQGNFHVTELPHEGSAMMELPQPSMELHDPHSEHFLRAQRCTTELPGRD